nr:dehydration-responsive element-binding protein 1A-like [Coffea arabica]
MDASSSCSDPHPFGSLSDVSPTTAQRAINSDEEIILSSSRPKKRAGRKKFKETRHPVYRGIRRRRWNSNKWVCELREPNKQSRIWLGTYPTAEMAARAYDVAALALRGHLACLNFADSVWRLPVPESRDAKDIRKAAAEAAEMFRSQEECDNTNSEASASGSGSDTSSMFMDDEALFDVHGLMAHMAEGLLLSPPHCLGDGYSFDDVENDAEVPLWSYTF